MKKRSIASTLGILAAAVSRVAFGQVALPYYDPLNYNAGGLGTQGPWFRANTLAGNDNPIDTAVNLSYTQTGNNVLPPSTGSALLLNTMGTSNAPQDRINLSASPTTFYYSLTLRVDALNTVNNTNGIFFASTSNLTDTTAGTVGTALRIRQDPTDSTKFNLGIDKDGAQGANSTWSGAIAVNGDTLLVVAKYQTNAGIGDDTASLWINPDATTFGSAEANVPSTVLSKSTGTDRVLNSFSLGVRGLTDPKKYVDEVRVGTNWASVVPTVWKGSDATYGATSNWYTGTVPDVSGIIPSFLDLSSASRTVSLGANRTLGGMVFSSASGYTINGGGSTITLDTPDVAGALISGSAGNHTIAAPVVLNSNLAGSVSAGTVTISGPVSGTAGVTMTGGAALVLTGSNSYSGNTTINGGVVRGVDGTGLPATTNLVLTGGAFESTASTFARALGTGAGQVQLPSGSSGFSAFGTPVSVTLDGGSTLVWAPTTTTTTFSPGALLLNAATANNTLTLTNNIDINGTNHTFTGNATGGNATAATISGTISNGGATTNGIIKNGVGLLVLTGTNTYNGQTQVLGGVLRGVDGVNIPNVVGGNSILTLQNGVYEPTTSTMTRPLGSTASGQVRLTGGAAGFSAFGTPLVVDIGGDGTGTGGTVLWGIADFQPTTLVLNASTATASIEFKNALNLGGAPAAARVIAVNAGTALMANGITGATASTGLTKTGPGTLQLRSATGNNFVGTLSISGGTFNITDGNQLGAASSTASLVLSGGGSLQFAQNLDLSNNRPIVIGAGGGTIDTNGFNNTGYGNVIGMGGGQTATLTKLGGGQFYTAAGNANGAVGTIIVKGGTFAFFNEGQIFGGGVSTNFTLDGGGIRTLTTWNASASHAITVTSNSGSVTIDNAQAVNWVGPITGAGVLSKLGGGTLTVSNIRGPGINVGAGRLNLAADGNVNGVSVVNSTAVNTGANAQLDLADNHLIDHTTGAGSWTGSDYTGVTGLIASGRNGNLWTGPGIITSQTLAAGGNYTSIGVAKASDVRPATATATGTWAGQTITGTDTLVMYTYGGDATLDGKLNVDDYIKIDSGIAANLTGWVNGDFNYDGKVSIDDYITIIDANIGNQSGVFFSAGGVSDGVSGVTAVPEPTSVGLVVLSAALLGRRRSRRAVKFRTHG